MRIAILLATTCLVSGCDEFNGKTLTMAGPDTVLTGSRTPFSDRELADLIKLSVPSALTAAQGSAAPAKPDGKPEASADAAFLNSTIGWFGTLPYADFQGLTGGARHNALRDARNQVQGMLMSRSAGLCTTYKLYLRARSTNTNFLLGSTGTLLGAAGAVVTGTASQALAGAAAGAIGTQAEYNKDILSSVTTSVIIPGIDRQRTALQQEISNRRCYGVGSYTLAQALLDAFRYHAACSTDVGIAAASSAINQSRSPSLLDARDALAAIKAMEATLAADPAAVEPPTRQSVPQIDTEKFVLLGLPISMGQCGSLDDNGLIKPEKDQVTPARAASHARAPRTATGRPAVEETRLPQRAEPADLRRILPSFGGQVRSDF